MPEGDAPTTADHRTHPRVPLALPATLIVAPDLESFRCMVTDISGGGAGLQYFEVGPSAERIARLEIREFGIFEGITVRDGRNKRGIRFLQGEAERNHLLPKLTVYVEQGLRGTSQYPAAVKLTLTRTGIQEKCDVLKISLQGVQLATEQRPPNGELVRLGRMYGRVAEHLSNGIEVRFLTFVSPGSVPPKSEQLHL